MTIGLNRDEVLLLDVVVARRFAELFPASDVFGMLRDLKAAGRLGLTVDDGSDVVVSVDSIWLLSVDQERLRLALLTDNPLAEVLAGELRPPDSPWA